MSRSQKGKGACYTERHARVSVHCDAVLCEADVYLADFRRWARQFYTNPL